MRGEEEVNEFRVEYSERRRKGTAIATVHRDFTSDVNV